MLRESGIYRIFHIESQKSYIGSGVFLYRRFALHKHQLIHKKHHSILLQRAWDKYGESAFQHEILEKVPVEKLIEREQYWIDFYKSSDPQFGYNVSPTAGNTLGKRCSDETKRKISETLHKKFSSGELINAFLGHKHSEETKRKVSRTKFGKSLPPFTEEHKKRISESNKGRSSWSKGLHGLPSLSRKGIKWRKKLLRTS